MDKVSDGASNLSLSEPCCSAMPARKNGAGWNLSKRRGSPVERMTGLHAKEQTEKWHSAISLVLVCLTRWRGCAWTRSQRKGRQGEGHHQSRTNRDDFGWLNRVSATALTLRNKPGS